tara:strand:- start:402 stop:1709 length:1308 start_codon:yes stop_codon:yes gene_type:complete
MKSGQKLYKKAKKLIPGGTMLFSKRPEMFLPENWPSYFSKTRGCNVWDLDGNKLTDMTLMGVGTNSLGYSNKIVDKAVMNTVKRGNLSTLNCPEEVYLAEKLIEINPWADMARFARSGGEANAIAIRIARAASGKDGVAICGYHGWHDWYLAANHNGGDKLSGHLLKGLSPLGVPNQLKNTTFPFNYNDFDSLFKIINENRIGVIKMEVLRNMEPKDDFLQKVRDLATEKNIVLIFDECTSGFRETFGGMHKKYKVEPDMAIFGKTIANGYALTTVVGRKNIMESAQNTFISSTFWTERIGPSAALASLKLIEEIQSYNIITKIGNTMRQGWKELADSNDLKISITGIPSLSKFAFESQYRLEYKTYLTQEMLKKGYLASTNFYASIAHNEKNISLYLSKLNDVFKVISECEKGYKNIHDLLKSPVCHSGFQRLN